MSIKNTKLRFLLFVYISENLGTVNFNVLLIVEFIKLCLFVRDELAPGFKNRN